MKARVAETHFHACVCTIQLFLFDFYQKSIVLLSTKEQKSVCPNYKSPTQAAYGFLPLQFPSLFPGTPSSFASADSCTALAHFYLRVLNSQLLLCNSTSTFGNIVFCPKHTQRPTRNCCSLRAAAPQPFWVAFGISLSVCATLFAFPTALKPAQAVQVLPQTPI